MNHTLATTLLAGFGLGLFTVDPEASTLNYQQDPSTLSLTGTDLLGETVGGYFNSSIDVAGKENLALRASLEGSNPQSPFLVELYSGDELDLVRVYEGSTSVLEEAGKTKDIPLTPVTSGNGNPADIRGVQFIWVGEGSLAHLKLHNLVESKSIDPELLRLADEAAALLADGTAWENLSSSQQSAHANVYPDEAIKVAGPLALDLMEQDILTPERVEGYVKFDNRWRKPLLEHGDINSSTLMNFSGGWSGWGRQFPVVRINNPVLPVEVVGSVQPIAVLSSGRFRGFYFLASVAEGVQGVTIQGNRSNFGTGYEALKFQGQNLRVIQPW
jgi:hypothetical protein